MRLDLRIVSMLGVTACAVALTAAAPASTAGAPAGEIVFVSPRATANPGEIYELAPGRAPRDISRSPYADVALSVSPVGRAFAFWSNRSARSRRTGQRSPSVKACFRKAKSENGFIVFTPSAAS